MGAVGPGLTQMNRILAFAVAFTLARRASADVHTFTEVVLKKNFIKKLKVLHIDSSRGPAVIDIGNSFYTNFGDDLSIAKVILTPVGTDVRKIVHCIRDVNEGRMELDKESIHNGSGRAWMSPLSQSAEVISKITITQSGAYLLHVGTCSMEGGAVSFAVSGANIGAHEHAWPKAYLAWAFFFVCVSAAWMSARRKWQTSPIAKDMFSGSLLTLGSYCAGFLYYVSPERELQETTDIPYTLFLTLTSAAVSSVMLSLLRASAEGFAGPGRCVRIVLYVLFCCVHLAAMKDYINEYDRAPADFRKKYKTSMLFALGCLLIFFMTCIRFLARSLRSFKESGNRDGLLVCRKLAVTIVVYTVLCVINALCRIYDAPGGPDSWTFHAVSVLVFGPLPQAYGLVSTLLIIWRTTYSRGELVPTSGADEESAVIGCTSGEKVIEFEVISDSDENTTCKKTRSTVSYCNPDRPEQPLD